MLDAFRVCRQLGITDPFEWLEHTGRNLANYWIAYGDLEPFGDDWRRTATIAALLHRILHLQELQAGIEPSEPLGVDDFMPTSEPREHRGRGRRLSDEEAMQALGMGFGFA